MTNKDFSDTFTTLVNSYSNQTQFGSQASLGDITVDEYEKSVFLTMAQNDIVTGLYSGKNTYGHSFETTEEMRRQLESLVKTKLYETSTDAVAPNANTGEPVSVTSLFFHLPDSLLYIVYEQVTISEGSDSRYRCFNGNTIRVYPVRHDEYNVIADNPFRGPSRFKALRIDSGNGYVELVSKLGISKYLIRYLSKPEPIILEDLPDGVTIEGESLEKECKLNSLLHQAILERAVMLALRSKGINAKADNK